MKTGLQRATEEDLAALDEASHGEWGDGLPLAAHRAREQALRSSPWSREAHTGWVWRQGAQILASCETYRMPCRVDGEPGTAWGIASVFVPAPLRGRGHASTMLQALTARLSGEPDARALVLFSDVGAPIYERLGFVARPAFDRLLAPSAAPLQEGPWTLLEEMALPHPEPPSHRFSLEPTAPQLGWHKARARTWAEAVGEPVSRWCGAALGDDVVVWVEDRHEGILRVLLWTGERLLLEAAARQAGALGLEEAQVWESSWDGPWPELPRRPRDGALPMLAPLRPGVDPEGWRLIPRGVWV
jgi:GNAT superfamily N-acetyltransferase